MAVDGAGGRSEAEFNVAKWNQELQEARAILDALSPTYVPQHKHRENENQGVEVAPRRATKKDFQEVLNSTAKFAKKHENTFGYKAKNWGKKFFKKNKKVVIAIAVLATLALIVGTGGLGASAVAGAIMASSALGTSAAATGATAFAGVVGGTAVGLFNAFAITAALSAIKEGITADKGGGSTVDFGNSTVKKQVEGMNKKDLKDLFLELSSGASHLLERRRQNLGSRVNEGREKLKEDFESLEDIKGKLDRADEGMRNLERGSKMGLVFKTDQEFANYASELAKHEKLEKGKDHPTEDRKITEDDVTKWGEYRRAILPKFSAYKNAVANFSAFSEYVSTEDKKLKQEEANLSAVKDLQRLLRSDPERVTSVDVIELIKGIEWLSR